jgi:ferric-dicitrate binding protein FerR (iron transport regulator)
VLEWRRQQQQQQQQRQQTKSAWQLVEKIFSKLLKGISRKHKTKEQQDDRRLKRRQSAAYIECST